MAEFVMDDGDTMLIRAIDLHNEAIAMARRLGIRGEVRSIVGKWEDGGQITGWTKRAKVGADEVLVEVFVSKLNEEAREFDRYARMYQALAEENKELRRQLAELEPVAA